MSSNSSNNVGIAFALVIGAGTSTGIGASVVFFPSLVRLASRRTLAGALGLSAGVMTYVSFVEILQKSASAFKNAGHGDKASILAGVCFFAGVVFMMLLNAMVTLFLGGHQHHHHHHDEDKKKTSTMSAEETQPQDHRDGSDKKNTSALDQAAADAVCPCHAEDPAGNLGKIHNMAESIIRQQDPAADPADWGNSVSLSSDDDDDQALNLPNDDDDDEEDHATTATEKKKHEKLMSMSIKTALAIALHNFPEGLATFVATLGDPKVGLVLAVAVAIHNIPEGLCVAMPIYYATGNKMKAFGWAMFSGLSEPIAALLGWAVLANSFSENMYGSMFGMVAGMMVIISIRELLPTAHRYDPEDSVITYSFIGGMAIIAISLMLFLL